MTLSVRSGFDLLLSDPRGELVWGSGEYRLYRDNGKENGNDFNGVLQG